MEPKTDLRSQIEEDSPPTDFEPEWEQFIHRVKLHELICYLQKEQKMIDLIKEFTDVKRILRKSLSKPGLGKPGEMVETPTESDLMFIRTLEEDTEKAKELYNKLYKMDKNVSRASIIGDLIATSEAVITEEQLQEMLKLCKDAEERQELIKSYEERERRRKYLHNSSEFRKLLYEFLDSKFFNYFMIVIVFLSTAILVLLTFETVVINFAYPLMVLDAFVISIFLLEAILKIFVYRCDYFKHLWHIIDIVILIVYFWRMSMEIITGLMAVTTTIQNSMGFKFLSSLRALRVLRAIKYLPSLKVVTSTIFQSFLSIGSIAVLMALFIFLYAVIGRRLFAEVDPEHFGHLGFTILTLFQLLTLDDWSDILEGVDKERRSLIYWAMFFYLFTYIFIEFFIFLNLFIAVLVDNFQLSLEESKNVKKSERGFLGWPRVIWDWAQILSIPKPFTKKVENEAFGKELKFEDYFSLFKDSKEAKLMESELKKLVSIDFQNYHFLRRLKLFTEIIDTALASKRNVWFEESSEPFNDPFFKLWTNIKQDIMGERAVRRFKKLRKRDKK